MKKALLLPFLFALLTPFFTTAQVCTRDSNILQTGGLLSPAPYAPDSPFYNLKPACIGDPYNQSVTVFVPDSFNYQGLIKVKINSVSIPTTGAIGNFPAGMTYSCDPPNCVFQPLTLGCILLNGTPASSNPADTVDLEITANVSTIIGTYPVKFPGDAAPGNHYYLIVKEMGNCAASGVSDAGSPFSEMRAMPNPVSQQTTIEVLSTQSGDFQFEVFDLLGKRVHARTVSLFEGANQFTFDVATLPAGTYVYTLGNATAGKSLRRLVKM